MKTNWQTKKLGDVVQIQNGFAFKSSEYTDSGFFVMRITNVQDGIIELNDPRYINESGKSFDNFILNENDILMSLTGNVGRVGTIKKKHLPAVLNQRVARLKVSDENQLDRDFLFYFLRSPKFFDEVVSGGKGMAQQNVSTKDIENLEIPLPPLTTQRQIVAILDEKFAKLREAKRLREEVIADTGKILGNVLREIFEEGKEKFEMTSLGDIANLVRGPFGGSLKKEIFVPTGIAVYEQGNVIDNILDNFRYFITSEKFEEMKRFEVSAGDILMSCSGTIGKFVIIPDNFTKGIINQALLKITPKKTSTVDYLKYALQDYLAISTTHVKGGAIKNIASVKELKQFSIPLPPLAEQKKIVTRLDALSEKLRTLRDLQTSQLADLKKLEKSYSREAFRGNDNYL